MFRLERNVAPILSTTVVIGVAAIALVASEAWRAADARAGRTSFAFQRLTRGIGGGAAVDMAGCPRCFDPRIAAVCASRLAPQPGGDAFCAEHSVAAFGWPSERGIDSGRDSDSRDGDAEASNARLP